MYFASHRVILQTAPHRKFSSWLLNLCLWGECGGGNGPVPQALSAMMSVFLILYANMVTGFALAVIQETLGRLDSCHDGDYSWILLRLEYLNRILINAGELPDSIVAGIGPAIACLSSVPTYRADRLFTGRRGRPLFNVWEDQLIFVADNGFKGPKISEMLGISKRTVVRRQSLM